MAGDGGMTAPLAVALLHHPVYDKNGRVVTTAVTNLDLHDIARVARTYGAEPYYLVTPAPEQQALAQKIVGHWQEGFGSTYNPRRKEALALVQVIPSLDGAVTDFAARCGEPPLLVATGARPRSGSLTCGELRERRLREARPLLLLFGTGWGLADEVFTRADLILAPITGADDYNPLSVRSAVAIILDRLLGGR